MLKYKLHYRQPQFDEQTIIKVNLTIFTISRSVAFRIIITGLRKTQVLIIVRNDVHFIVK